MVRVSILPYLKDWYLNIYYFNYKNGTCQYTTVLKRLVFEYILL